MYQGILGGCLTVGYSVSGVIYQNLDIFQLLCKPFYWICYLEAREWATASYFLLLKYKDASLEVFLSGTEPMREGEVN